MLWENYVFRRGSGVHSLWDSLYANRKVRLLYITGAGFDSRAPKVLDEYLKGLRTADCEYDDCKLLQISLAGYELNEDLLQVTETNAEAIRQQFHQIGRVENVTVKATASREAELTATQALRSGIDQVLDHIDGQTDIVLDVSSLPRVVYLAILTSVLHKLIGDERTPARLGQVPTNLQILVAEDAALDAKILAEDLGSEIVTVPGFSRALMEESIKSWPLVWFPILGEGRVGQLQRILSSNVISETAEICPVLPSPSRDPRRADLLLTEYREALFPNGVSSISNFLLVHEAHPFEAYRQLLQAMERYRESLEMLGGCRLYVSPLGSKLITLGAGLACFDLRSNDAGAKYRISIPHAEPTRYRVDMDSLAATKPEICSLLLTGEAYSD